MIKLPRNKVELAIDLQLYIGIGLILYILLK